MGPRGAIAAGHPLAASAGLHMLEEGGGALDACLAAAFMAWVLMPDMCGLGGDMFVLWRGADGAAAISGSGPSPATYPGTDGRRPALALVPGAPSTLQALMSYLRLPLEALLAPAIATARAGFVAHPLLARKIAALPPGTFREQLLKGWQWSGVDRPLRWPAMAETLGRLAAGEDPVRLVLDSLSAWREAGALLQPQDIEGYRAAIETPLQVNMGGWRFWGQPAMSQAATTLSSLLRSGMDWLLEEPSGAKTHILVEAYKSAYSELDRFGHAGDTAGTIARLLDPVVARAKRNGFGYAASDGPAMMRNYGETTQVAASDQFGTTCTLIHSLYRPFGAQAICEATGLIANDRGASFDGGANAPAPGQRPRHTLVGVMAESPDGGRIALGTPGAQAQTQTTLQVLAALVACPDDPIGAVLAPRWSFIGGKDLSVEADIPTAVLDDMAARGHRLSLRPARDWLMGSVSLASWRQGMCEAVADDRRNALALAL